ncbi:MAG: flagellar basal-body MS-ring/collar protein FliF [Hyphomicrobiaceae bacterium]|nr:flagellar basal-body MS-ring/collar protein FliF [Hyphomicrobiaceae bacterium]
MLGFEQLERLWRNLLGLGGRKLAALAFVGTAVFGLVGLGSYYLSRPDLETLYTGLNAQDVTRIGSALREAGIQFDINAAGNAVLVRYGQTAQARMLLAEKGLPSSSNAGYELFDKLGSMGLTSFMQEVTRVRALEGEIARSIQAIRNVKAARVHLVMPEAGSFRRTRQAPSASVIVRTENPADFQSGQAIRHLVAAAVPGMSIDQVTVLNMDGTVMAASGDASAATPNKNMTLEKTVAKEMQDNIAKTLMPYLGINNFEISVAARINTDKKQTSETTYNPESRVERSVRVVKETGSSQNSQTKQGVGADQNVPADQAGAAAGANGDQSRKQNERREELTNYEVGTKTTQTVSEGYRIENLNIAVVLNRKRLMETLGANATPEMLDKHIKEVERLVVSASGVDLKRGDQIAVSALEFAQGGMSLDPVPAVGWGEMLGRQLGSFVNAGALVLITALLIWFGVRPAMRAILEAPSEAQPGAITASGETQDAVEIDPVMQAMLGGGGGGGATRAASSGDTSLIADLTEKLDRAPQKRLEQMVDFDEEQAAAILKQWLREAEPA